MQHGHSEGYQQKPKQAGFYNKDCTKDRKVFHVAPKHTCSDKGAPPSPTCLQETSRQLRYSTLTTAACHQNAFATIDMLFWYSCWQGTTQGHGSAGSTSIKKHSRPRHPAAAVSKAPWWVPGTQAVILSVSQHLNWLQWLCFLAVILLSMHQVLKNVNRQDVHAEAAQTSPE